MFTSKNFYNFAVYMLRNLETGASYIGSSTQVHHRLSAHEICFRLRSPSSPTYLLDAFPDHTQVEYRIIESFEVPQGDPGHSEQTDQRRAIEKHMRNREQHWIRSLKPSLNRRVLEVGTPVESLPKGPPTVLHAVA